MTVDAAPAVRLVEIMIGIRVCYCHKFPHDTDDFIGT